MLSIANTGIRLSTGPVFLHVRAQLPRPHCAHHHSCYCVCHKIVMHRVYACCDCGATAQATAGTTSGAETMTEPSVVIAAAVLVVRLCNRCGGDKVEGRAVQHPPLRPPTPALTIRAPPTAYSPRHTTVSERRHPDTVSCRGEHTHSHNTICSALHSALLRTGRKHGAGSHTRRMCHATTHRCTGH